MKRSNSELGEGQIRNFGKVKFGIEGRSNSELGQSQIRNWGKVKFGIGGKVKFGIGGRSNSELVEQQWGRRAPIFFPKCRMRVKFALYACVVNDN